MCADEYREEDNDSRFPSVDRELKEFFAVVEGSLLDITEIVCSSHCTKSSFIIHALEVPCVLGSMPC